MKISACMMVKNEERHLPGCLESLKGFVDEIVAVDTGSEDNTIQILRDAGGKVLEYPWKNDFSFHRNQSIGLATGDWVFIIDADERFLCDDIEAFRRTLKDIDLFGKNAVTLELVNREGGVETSRWLSARFFRNGKVQYKGRVHNQPVVDGGHAFFTKGAQILHLGYDENEYDQKAKRDRTVGLLLKDLEDTGNPHCHYWLAQQYGSQEMERFEDCLEQCKLYAEKKEQIGEEFCDGVYTLGARIAMRMGMLDEAWRWVRSGLAANEVDLDLNAIMADLAIHQNNLIQGKIQHAEGMDRAKEIKFCEMLMRTAVEACERYLAAYEDYTQNPPMTSSFIFTYRPEMKALNQHRLSMIYAHWADHHWNGVKESLGDLPPWLQLEIQGEALRVFGSIDLSVGEGEEQGFSFDGSLFDSPPSQQYQEEINNG